MLFFMWMPINKVKWISNRQHQYHNHHHQLLSSIPTTVTIIISTTTIIISTITIITTTTIINNQPFSQFPQGRDNPLRTCGGSSPQWTIRPGRQWQSPPWDWAPFPGGRRGPPSEPRYPRTGVLSRWVNELIG